MEDRRSDLRFAWLIVSASYTGITALHLVLVTRPGHSASLSQALRLPSIFRASSVRSSPSCWTYGGLSAPFKEWAQPALVWASLTGVKWLFEYYLLSKQLASQVCAPPVYIKVMPK